MRFEVKRQKTSAYRRLQLQAAVSLQAVEQAVADTAERAADPAKTSADGTLQQAIAHARTCSVAYCHPVEYNHACEGDVLTIVRTDSEHIA